MPTKIADGRGANESARNRDDATPGSSGSPKEMQDGLLAPLREKMVAATDDSKIDRFPLNASSCWAGGGRSSQRTTDRILADALGTPYSTGRSFRHLDFPQLGTPTIQAVEYGKRDIGELPDVGLDAWLADRSFEPVRVGMPRPERELLAMRVRKLPCAAEATECAYDAFVAHHKPAEEDSRTDALAACEPDPLHCTELGARGAAMIDQMDDWLGEEVDVWLTGLGRTELNGRRYIVVGPRTGSGATTRYPLAPRPPDGAPYEARDAILVRPANMRPGAPPKPLPTPSAATDKAAKKAAQCDTPPPKPVTTPVTAPAPPKEAPAAPASDVDSALREAFGADVGGLISTKAFAAIVADVDAKAKEAKEDQWAEWKRWIKDERMCYVSFEPEGNGGGGGLCSRCKHAWYSSRSAQAPSDHPMTAR